MEKFRNLSVSRKIGLTVFLILVGILALGVLNLRDAARINKRVNNLYTQELKPLIALNSIKGAMYRYRDRTVRYLSEADSQDRERHLKHLETQKQRIFTEIDKYRETRLSKEEADLLNKFESVWKEYVKEVETKVIPLANQGMVEEAKMQFFKSALQKFRQARDSINSLITYQEKRAYRRYVNANRIYENVRNISIVLLLALIGVSAALGFNLIKSIKNPVFEVQDAIKKLSEGNLMFTKGYESKDEMGKTLSMLGEALNSLNLAINEAKQVANENSSISDELSSTTTEVSKQIENMVTSVQVMKEEGENVIGVVNTTIGDAHKARDIIDSAAAELNKSKDKVLEISQAVKNFADNELTLAKKVEGLKEHSKEVVSIANIISDIAEQTNLLALNTAIEAARAGEHGRGFAVVADEIRKLSQKIQDSLESVDKIVDTIIASIEDVSQQMQHNSNMVLQLSESAVEISKVIDEVVNRVASAKDSYKKVVEGFMENKAAVENIIQKLKDIDEVATVNARSIEEISATAEQLRLVTEELRGKLSAFKTA